MNRRNITRKLEKMSLKIKTLFIFLAFVIMLFLHYGVGILSNNIYGVGIGDIPSIFVNIFFQLGSIVIFAIFLVLFIGIAIGEITGRLLILSISLLSGLLLSFILLLGGI